MIQHRIKENVYYRNEILRNGQNFQGNKPSAFNFTLLCPAIDAATEVKSNIVCSQKRRKADEQCRHF